MADEERGGVRRWALRMGSLLAVLPVIYVLSIGPVVAWCARQDVSNERLESLNAFYWPLVALAQQSSWFADAIFWYMDLWY